MERLTDKKIAEEAKTHIAQCNSKGFPVDYICQRYVRLAAYEDTGLEPEEVLAMIKEVLKFEEIRDSIKKRQDIATNDDVISREAAIRACESWMDRMGIRGLYRLGLLISLKYLSPANRLHAKWVRDDDYFPVCSHCGKEDIISQDGGGCFYEPPYCMWCGARMDGDGK